MKLQEGNVFTPVCHSVHGVSLYDVTSCLTAMSHVPSGHSLSREVSVKGWSLSNGEGGLCERGSL